MSWTETNNSLVKTFVFKDFLRAMAWMQYCAPAIEELQHHPEWSNVYNKVSVVLRTHDAGNIVSPKDHELAAILDRCYATFMEQQNRAD